MDLLKTFFGYVSNRPSSFPGQQPGEEVEHMTVFHWMKLVPYFFYLSVFATILVVLNFFSDFFLEFPPLLRFYINTVSVGLLIHLACYRLYNYILKVLIITNHRVIDIRHSVFLKREREVIPMFNIQDLHYQQNGILPRLFNYGDLVVFGSSSDVKYEFKYVIKVNKIHHLICEIRQKLIHDNPAMGLGSLQQPRNMQEFSLAG